MGSVSKKEEKEEQDQRNSFERGVSVERELVFTKAVGNFWREAVRVGGTKGRSLQLVGTNGAKSKLSG